MPHQDRYGCPISTSSAQAASAYCEGVDLMLAAWPGAAEAFERAIALDPDFALAQIARARIHAFYQEGSLARAKAASARAVVAQMGTDRERSHVETLALAIEGRGDAAIAGVLGHLDTWPRDAVVLSLPLGAFGLFAFSGMADHDQARQNLCERHAGIYGDDWWFLSSYGWALTENGAVARGRAVTERGFEMRRQNAHGAHALLHAMFEDGSIDDADALIEEWSPSYHRSGILYGHIRWHQALAALERDDAVGALAIYRDVLTPETNPAPPLNVMSDCASLLWRLLVQGHAVPHELWQRAEHYGTRHFPNSSLGFVEVHMALLAAATFDDAALEERLRALEQRLAEGRCPPGPVVPAICRAVRAFAAGDARRCVAELEPVLADVTRIGGSHAQREIVEDTFIVALIRSGDVTRARERLDARLHRRPSPRDARWRAAADGK